jgi:hypothetical protein
VQGRRWDQCCDSRWKLEQNRFLYIQLALELVNMKEGCMHNRLYLPFNRPPTMVALDTLPLGPPLTIIVF